MDGYIGEIRMMPFNFAPVGWLYCDGRLESIPQYQALYSLIGTLFGGDGKQTFGLPNLQSLAPVGLGTANNGAGTTNWTLNYKNTVEESVTLTSATTPSHTHTVTSKIVPSANTATDMKAQPSNNTYLSRGLKQKPASLGTGYEAIPLYNAAVATAGTLPNPTIGLACGNGANPTAGHENRQPYLAMGFFICVEGEYPIVS